ncbi:hypothetical protein ACIQ7Q_34280 [Streptomyces sp. NPDC096176]|uniref:hypothetical protein n=1 Tax=Streptomyces sp. NPDC096176 TaxID=3366079 RepID=UPI0038206A9D
MPSQDPQNTSARNKTTPGEQPDGTGPIQRRITLSVPVPRRVSLTGATAVTGSSALAGAIASGHAPTEPVYVYSLVALSIATMAYDIARKSLRLRGA